MAVNNESRRRRNLHPDNPVYVNFEQVKDSDCLFGKGKNRMHIGNVAFRALIRSRVDHYQGAPSRGYRVRIIIEALNSIDEAGGRMLRLHDEAQKIWIIMDRETARDKVGDSIRDIIKTRKRRKIPEAPRNDIVSSLDETASFASIMCLLSADIDKRLKKTSKKKRQAPPASHSRVGEVRARTRITLIAAGPIPNGTTAPQLVGKLPMGSAVPDDQTLLAAPSATGAASAPSRLPAAAAARRASTNDGLVPPWNQKPTADALRNYVASKKSISSAKEQLKQAGTDPNHRIIQQEMELERLLQLSRGVASTTSNPKGVASSARVDPTLESWSSQASDARKRYVAQQRAAHELHVAQEHTAASSRQHPASTDIRIPIGRSQADLVQSSYEQDLHVARSRYQMDQALSEIVQNHSEREEGAVALSRLHEQHFIGAGEIRNQTYDDARGTGALLRRPGLPSNAHEEHIFSDSAKRLAAALEMQRVARTEIERETRLLTQSCSRSDSVQGGIAVRDMLLRQQQQSVHHQATRQRPAQQDIHDILLAGEQAQARSRSLVGDYDHIQDLLSSRAHALRGGAELPGAALRVSEGQWLAEQAQARMARDQDLMSHLNRRGNLEGLIAESRAFDSGVDLAALSSHRHPFVQRPHFTVAPSTLNRSVGTAKRDEVEQELVKQRNAALSQLEHNRLLRYTDMLPTTQHRALRDLQAAPFQAVGASDYVL